MDAGFADKVVLVTGATSGIGRACALRFAAGGARIAAIGRNEDELSKLEKEAGSANNKTLLIRADLSRTDEAERVVEHTVKAAGGIDVLVNAAGHIANARHIQEAQLPDRMKELEKFRSRPIIVSCGAGSRAPGVTGRLRKQGFAEVFALRGGVAAWQQASLPLEKG